MLFLYPLSPTTNTYNHYLRKFFIPDKCGIFLLYQHHLHLIRFKVIFIIYMFCRLNSCYVHFECIFLTPFKYFDSITIWFINLMSALSSYNLNSYSLRRKPNGIMLFQSWYYEKHISRLRPQNSWMLLKHATALLSLFIVLFFDLKSNIDLTNFTKYIVMNLLNLSNLLLIVE